MRKLLLFDVDGTLVESACNINSAMREQLLLLQKYYDIGICGGGVLTKITEQLNGIIFNHYFTECGCVYHKFVDNEYKLIYKKDLRKHESYDKINILIKTALQFLSTVPYTVTGHFIDVRNGIIYISLIGMNANETERKTYIHLDNTHGYRSELINLLKQKALDIDLQNISICEGGQVGIGLYPDEYDKIQILDILTNNYKEIHYFGDKYLPNGNDYKLLNNECIIGHKINNINETFNELVLLTDNILIS